MKPGFALLLSVDGISLLHRAAGGWRSVGDVSPDAADLAGELADLRRRALALEPDGVSCKVIIPNDQIRYLSTRTGTLNRDARQLMVRRALEGATPYDVDDLAFDISVEGDTAHVAAVARETLAEAEAFAVQHHFNPVGFVAIPADQAYPGEPFFGPATQVDGLADGDRMEPDGIAVVVIGPARNPAPAPAIAAKNVAAAAPGAGAQSESPPQATEAALSETGQTPGRDRVAAPPAIPPAPESGSAPGIVPAPEPEPEIRAKQELWQPEPAPDFAAAGFASRRHKPIPAAPALAGVSRAASAQAAASEKTPPPDSALPRADTPATPPVVEVTAPVLDIPDNEDLKVAGAATDTGPRSATPDASAPGGFLSRRKSRPSPAAPDVVAAPVAAITTEAPPDTAALGLTPEDEIARMTVFGARMPAKVRGKPRFLGLALAVGLLLFLAAVAAWAVIFSDGRLARYLRLNPDATELAAEPEPAAPDVAAPDPVQIDVPVNMAPTPTSSMPPVTSELAPMAPGTLTEPQPEVTGLTDADAAVLDALRETLSPAPIAAPALPDVPNAQTRYAATGIWQTAPQKLRTPSIIGLDDLYVASIDRTDLFQDAVALPSPGGLDTDLALASVTSPLAAGTVIALDPGGLVTPTTGGTLNPDGILIYLGPPPVVPPDTPTRFEIRPGTASILRNRLAGLRPRLRPANLSEQNERTQLGGMTRAELAAKRPKLRPKVPEKPAKPETPEAPRIAETPATGTTADAPDSRQDDAPRAVARQSDRGAGAPSGGRDTRIAVIAPRTVKPSMPSPPSVARQATLENAINLRRINLIGVYGTPSSRRALVRLPSGRYKKVRVGDSLDGGRIVAIGDSELRYQKSGRNVILKIPSG
jgi:hypothetical protein